MEIIAFKLITGEDILGELEGESEVRIVVKHPVAILTIRGNDGKPSVGFAPFPTFAEIKTNMAMCFEKQHIIYSYEPAEDFKENYEKVFGSGLILPPTPRIVA